MMIHRITHLIILLVALLSNYLTYRMYRRRHSTFTITREAGKMEMTEI